MLPDATGLDDHAHVFPLRKGADNLDRRRKINDVESLAQVIRQACLEEFDDQRLALLPYVYAG